jgi:alanine racemase
MTFSLTVDATKFRGHLVSVMNQYAQAGADLVPVIKGNGYGFGRTNLAREASRLGANRIAIGTVWELEQSLVDFAGEVVVLEPFNASDQAAKELWQRILSHGASRVIVTLSDLDFAGVAGVGAKLIYLEGKTSLDRFGLTASEISQVSNANGLTVRGLSLHMPISDPKKVIDATTEISSSINSKKISGRLLEIWNWIVAYQDLAVTSQHARHISLSHVTSADLIELKVMCKSYNYELTFEVRVGTQLWLGENSSCKVQGTVLEIHELTDHQRVGYRQVDSHGYKRLVVVSGGTAHGVALAAPSTSGSMRQRGISIAEGVSQALGKVRSPFSYKGENLIFAEPPHMQVSMLWSNDMSLNVGDQLACNVRNTTTTFDVVSGLN